MRHQLFVIAILIIAIGVSCGCRDVAATRMKFQQTKCTMKMKMIHLALSMYAGDNGGYFPEKSGVEGLKKLVRGGYLGDFAEYICPSMDIKAANSINEFSEEHVSYFYIGGLSEHNNTGIPLFICKSGNHGHGTLYCDIAGASSCSSQDELFSKLNENIQQLPTHTQECIKTLITTRQNSN